MVEPGSHLIRVLDEHLARTAARRRVEPGETWRTPSQHHRVHAAEHAQRERATSWRVQVTIEHPDRGAPGAQVASRMVEQAGVERAAERLAGHRLELKPLRGPRDWGPRDWGVPDCPIHFAAPPSH